MKKINRKKLNNKGFTLIELLAVVVILAVVMGIATTSVLSAMNKSRGGSLQDTAMIIANAFNQKYTESLVDGVPSNVYGDVLDVKDASGNVTANGYNFQSDATYYIVSGLADTFGISASGYAMDTSAKGAAVTSNDTSGIGNSFVQFNVTTGKFVVCMFANKSGSYFVDNYKATAIEQVGTTGVYAANGEMYACSDGTKSW